MSRCPGRNYFIVKHDLASFQALPGFIWNSHKRRPPGQPPIGFRQVKKGDCWISFAYMTSGSQEKAVSLVTGFYECVVRQPRFGKLPPKAQASALPRKWAWLIEGKSMGASLADPVVIPPLTHFLGKNLFSRRTISRIRREQFEAIRNYTREHRFPPEKIPCLEREPTNEQEVLTIVASDPEQLGIKKIIRVQTRFPDMLVKLKGKAEEVHLELELYSSSFLGHRHEKQVRRRRFTGNGKSKGDNKPVGVLCWIDYDKDKVVKGYVHQVYVLSDLLKKGEQIRW